MLPRFATDGQQAQFFRYNVSSFCRSSSSGFNSVLLGKKEETRALEHERLPVRLVNTKDRLAFRSLKIIDNFSCFVLLSVIAYMVNIDFSHPFYRLFLLRSRQTMAKFLTWLMTPILLHLVE